MSSPQPSIPSNFRYTYSNSPTYEETSVQTRVTQPRDDIFKELRKLKHDLYHCQDKLSNYSLDEWGFFTRSRNNLADLARVLRAFYNPPPLMTNAYLKLHEIFVGFPELLHNDSDTFVSVHLCEMPGAFVSTVHDHLAGQKALQWYATSLNPLYEAHPATSSLCCLDMIVQYGATNWCFGATNTGNIFDEANLDEILDKVWCYGGADLVTADGSVDCLVEADEDDSQEAHVLKLHQEELTWAIKILKEGGSIVVKRFTLQEPRSIAGLYILVQCFADVSLIKPLCSRPGNSEIYVIGHRFNCGALQTLCGCVDPTLDQIRAMLNDVDHVPTEFVRAHLENVVKPVTSMQMNQIEDYLAAYSNLSSWRRSVQEKAEMPPKESEVSRWIETFGAPTVSEHSIHFDKSFQDAHLDINKYLPGGVTYHKLKQFQKRDPTVQRQNIQSIVTRMLRHSKLSTVLDCVTGGFDRSLNSDADLEKLCSEPVFGIALKDGGGLRGVNYSLFADRTMLWFLQQAITPGGCLIVDKEDVDGEEDSNESESEDHIPVSEADFFIELCDRLLTFLSTPSGQSARPFTEGVVFSDGPYPLSRLSASCVFLLTCLFNRIQFVPNQPFPKNNQLLTVDWTCHGWLEPSSSSPLAHTLTSLLKRLRNLLKESECAPYVLLEFVSTTSLLLHHHSFVHNLTRCNNQLIALSLKRILKDFVVTEPERAPVRATPSPAPSYRSRSSLSNHSSTSSYSTTSSNGMMHQHPTFLQQNNSNANNGRQVKSYFTKQTTRTPASSINMPNKGGEGDVDEALYRLRNFGCSGVRRGPQLKIIPASQLQLNNNEDDCGDSKEN